MGALDPAQINRRKARERPNKDRVLPLVPAGERTRRLARLARIVQPISAKEKEFNNHAYWTGLGVAAAGIAANDRSLFDWGIGKFDLGADAVTADGTLPLEMKRGQRAIHSHFFALTPLVYLAELGEANGLEPYARNGGAIKRLVERSVAGSRDPRWFALRAGATQDIVAGGKL